MVFLLLAAVRIAICSQGARAGHLYTSPQHCHRAHGLCQGVLAPCTPADGARCWVSVLNTGNFEFSWFVSLLPLRFLLSKSIDVFTGSRIPLPLYSMYERQFAVSPITEQDMKFTTFLSSTCGNHMW